MIDLSAQIEAYRLSCQILANELIPSGDPQFNAKHPRNPDGTFTEKPKPQDGLLKTAVEGVVVTGLGLTAIGYLGKRRTQFNKANRKATAAAATKTAADTIVRQQREFKEASDRLVRSLAERDAQAKARADAAAARSVLKERKAAEVARAAKQADERAVAVGKKLSRIDKKIQVKRGVKMLDDRNRALIAAGGEPDRSPANPLDAMKFFVENHFFARSQAELRPKGPGRLDNSFMDSLMLEGDKVLRWRDAQMKLLMNQRPKPTREVVQALDLQLEARIASTLGSVPDIGVQKGGDYSLTSKIQEIIAEDYVEKTEQRTIAMLNRAASKIEAERQAVLDAIDTAVNAANERLEQGAKLPPPRVKNPRKQKNRRKSPTQGKGFGKVQ
jgi:hypothetical protein